MSFDALATSTISTKRPPAMNVTTGLSGARVTHLENVKVHPIMPIERRQETEVKARVGRTEQAVQLWQTFTEKHAHTDDGAPVTQVPDIVEEDEIVDGSNAYNVLAVKLWPATAGQVEFLEIFLEQAK